MIENAKGAQKSIQDIISSRQELRVISEEPSKIPDQTLDTPILGQFTTEGTDALQGSPDVTRVSQGALTTPILIKVEQQERQETGN
jgi:hypothetical protein